ncbi:hypothetical protein [Kitasatospora kifunensis]|uniref:Uncharacterized protein n=1 Tax=Kitasatospora kifunensis TaxID=58351 RepID=A0A7W7R1P8_KITKI|nr:hypothetical protein [Kitasatospora kifunensis]MBB4923777.1 hypothetical protein [Kitasatospora kifunensis]
MPPLDLMVAPGEPKPGLVMRYEVVEAAGSHVLRDVVLGEFCTLPDPSGRSVLLAFPDAYHARLWLMQADTRKQYAVSTTRVRAEQRKKPLPEHADWLLFDLYTEAPAEPPTGLEMCDQVAVERTRQAVMRSERLRHRHQH